MMLENTVNINDAGADALPVVPLEFEGHAVRMRIDAQGNPWWVARDVCEVLGVQNPSDTLAKCIEADEKGVDTVYTAGGSQLGWARLCEVEVDLPTASRVGKPLTVICDRRGLHTGSVRDPRFGSVRTYPESVLREFFGGVLNGEVSL